MRAGVCGSEQAFPASGLRLACPRALLAGAHGLSLGGRHLCSSGGGTGGGAGAGPAGGRRRPGLRFVTAATVQPDWSGEPEEAFPPKAPEPPSSAAVSQGGWRGCRCWCYSVLVLQRAGATACWSASEELQKGWVACLAGGQAPEEGKRGDGEPTRGQGVTLLVRLPSLLCPCAVCRFAQMLACVHSSSPFPPSRRRCPSLCAGIAADEAAPAAAGGARGCCRG